MRSRPRWTLQLSSLENRVITIILIQISLITLNQITIVHRFNINNGSNFLTLATKQWTLIWNHKVYLDSHYNFECNGYFIVRKKAILEHLFTFSYTAISRYIYTIRIDYAQIIRHIVESGVKHHNPNYNPQIIKT